MGEMTSIWRVGGVVDGRYEVIEVLGEGGMGVVYRVRHLAWDIDLAVKCPQPDLFLDEKAQRRFVVEAETWVSLGLHPNVCNCFYVRVFDGAPRVFAEYVAGGSLHGWINDRRLYHGDPPEVLTRILDVAIQTAWGLDYAHGRGLVHRDVKPANVLLDPDGGEGGMVIAKVTDFGLARAREMAATVSPDAPSGISLLAPGGSWMTPLYASPEQAKGEPVGRRTDIYSFAVSVLEMCVGEVTWMAGPAAGAALAGYRTDDTAGAVVVPPALGDLLEQCLRQDPDDRPNSMADVAAELIDIYRDVMGRDYTRPVPIAAELRADELNNRAVSLLDLGRQDEADQTFAQALAADPQNVRTIYNAGLVRWHRGAVTDEGLLAEIEAIRADTGDPWEARYALAQINLERGDLVTAGKLLGELARERPDELEVQTALRKVRSGDVVDARGADEWQVPWPSRRPPYGGSASQNRVSLALTPDGRRMLAGGWDGMVRAYNVHSRNRVWTLNGHRKPVVAVDVTPDGRFAVSASVDETLWFWDLTMHRFWGWPKGRCLSRPQAGTHMPDQLEQAILWLRSPVRLTPDGRFALYAGVGGGFRVWNTYSGLMRTLHGSVELIEVSPDGQQALTSDKHGRRCTVRLWNLAGGRCEREMTVPESMVTALCFSADGRYAATGDLWGRIRVWDLADGRCVHVLTGEKMTVEALSLSADARFLLSGSNDLDGESSVRLWEIRRGRCLRTLPSHRGGTTVVHLDADARFALTAGQDRTVRRWELPPEHRSAPLLSRPRRHVELNRLAGRVDALVAGAEQAMAAGRLPPALDLLRQARAATGYERAPRVMSAWWALGRRAVRTGLRAAWSSRTWSTDEVRVGDLSADGRIAVSGCSDGKARLWDLDSGNCLQVLGGHGGMVTSVCLSADARWILSSADRDEGVRLWEVDTGLCRNVLTGDGKAQSVRFGAYGQQAVVAYRDGRIRIWDLETGGPPRETRIPDRGSLEEIYLCDDGRIAAVLMDYQLKLYDLNGDRIVHRLRSRSQFAMESASLSADGRITLGGSKVEDDEGLRFWLWDNATGEAIRAFEGPPQDGFQTVRMTADGRFAVSSGYESYMTVWDVHSGQVLRVLDGHERGERCLALTPDGRFVLAVHGGNFGYGGELRVWQLDWELAAREAADWDDGAAPYLEAFLHRYGPQWTVEDFEALLRRLQDVGYGWLRADGVRAQLDRIASGTAR